jgi:hypothetical protein
MSHPNEWRGLGCLAIMTALGCADETVNLGGGGVGQIRRGARCRESPIVSESVRVTSQADLESLAGCEEIDGDLMIQVFAGADLSPLASLRVIDGLLALGAEPDLGEGIASEQDQLLIAERDQILADGYLPTLTGLDALERVAGLDFYGIAAEDLDPLLSLRALSGRSRDRLTGLLSIVGTRLRSLQGLANVEGVDDLAIVDNPGLESLAGLVLGEFPRNVAVMGSPKIGSMPELSPLIYINTLSLYDLGITDLSDLANLYSVESSLVLFGNRNLVNVDWLAGVNAAQLQIEKNPALESIPPLSEMVWLESFIAADNSELKTINLDLPPHGAGPDIVQGEILTDPIKVIDIGRNPKLTGVSLAAGLERGRFLAIYENPSLSSVSMGTLTSLEEVNLAENASLGSVDLGALETVQSLLVTDNPSLDTTGLAALRTFETRLEGNASDPGDAGPIDAGP